MSWRAVDCPICGARAGEVCRSRPKWPAGAAPRRASNPHVERVRASRVSSRAVATGPAAEAVEARQARALAPVR